MIDNSKEYILCAAIKRKEAKPETCLYNNDIHTIEIGFRHPDIRDRFPGEMNLSPRTQGFYTSRGRFVSREEAMKIAYECGQVSEDKAISCRSTPDNIVYNDLFSEDLY